MSGEDLSLSMNTEILFGFVHNVCCFFFFNHLPLLQELLSLNEDFHDLSPAVHFQWSTLRLCRAVGSPFAL